MAIVLSGTTGIDAGSLPVNNCGNTEVEGNLNLSGVGARITGDFSNATTSNRVAFQSSVTNGNTGVYAIPNTVSGAAAFRVTNSNDLVNHNSLEISASQGATAIISNSFGTASPVPLTFYTSGSERMRIDTAGRVGLGTTTPVTILDVVGDGRFQQQATSGTSGAIIIKEDSGSVNGGVLQWVNPANTLQRGAIKVKPDYSWEISNGNNNMFKISSAGDFLATLGTGGLGYGTGAGGTVTQLTSKSTAVTLNKPSGQITMNNAALAAGASVYFTVQNSLVAGSDNINAIGFYAIVNPANYKIEPCAIYTGNFQIRVTNITGGALAEALIIEYTVIKGAVA